MTCQERQDQLLLLAFDQLDANEERELREHLATGCPACAGAWAEARAIAGMMPLALGSVLPDKKVKERVMERARVKDVKEVPDTIKLPVGKNAPKQSSWFMPAAIAAAVAVFVTGIAAYMGPVRHLQAKNVALDTQLNDAKTKADAAEGHAKAAESQAADARVDAKSANDRATDAMTQVAKIQDQLAAASERAASAKSQLVAVQTDLDKTKHDLETARSNDSSTQTQLTSLKQEIKDDESKIGAMRDQIQKAQLNESFVHSPGLQLVNLQTKNDPAASGHILSDPVSGRWLFVANGLKNPGPGKTYELWIITDKAMPAGTFNVDDSGEGTLLVNLPAGVHITQAAVTDEPAGGVAKPTGTMQLIGAVQRS